MEGAHGELGARLADGLGRDDAHRLADVHRAAGGQVGAIALGANAALAAAGKYAAALDGLDPCGDNLIPYIIGNQLVAANDQLPGIGIVHILCGIPAQQPVAQGFHHVVAVQDGGDGHTLGAFAPALAAILLPDDHVLGYVHQAAGQIARVRRAQGRIRQALPGAVGGDEELQHRQAFPEVGPDGHLDDLARGVCHQAAHPRQLADLVGAAAGAGIGHHVDGIVLIQGLHQGVGHVVRGLFPYRDHVPAALCAGEHTVAEQVIDLLHFPLRVGQDLLLLLRHGDVLEADGDAALGGIFVAQGLDIVQHLAGTGGPIAAVAAVHDVAQVLLHHQLIHFQLEHVVQGLPGHIAQVLGNGIVEDQAAQAGIDDPAVGFALPLPLNADLDLALQGDDPGLIGHGSLVLAAKHLALALEAVPLEGQVIAAHDHILGGAGHRLAVLGLEDVVGGQHQETGFRLGFHAQGHMHGHLVAVEVRVKGGTYQGMELDGPAFHQHRLKGLDAQAVQGRRTVQQHRVFLDDVFQHVPHLGFDPLHHPLGALDVMGVGVLHQLLHDEGLKQLQRHFLGQAALIHLQFRPYHDNRTAGIVHPLAQQVLAEAPLLAPEHIRKGLKGPVARARNRAAPAAVVDEGVHGLLEHPLFVAHDDVRRPQLQEPLKPVVPVDDPAVQVV